VSQYTFAEFVLKLRVRYVLGLEQFNLLSYGKFGLSRLDLAKGYCVAKKVRDTELFFFN